MISTVVGGYRPFQVCKFVRDTMTAAFCVFGNSIQLLHYTNILNTMSHKTAALPVVEVFYSSVDSAIDFQPGSLHSISQLRQAHLIRYLCKLFDMQ